MLLKVTSKDAETFANALIKNARKLPQELYKSLTWDRGTEMAGHKRFTLATDIQVYFCGSCPRTWCKSQSGSHGLRHGWIASQTVTADRLMVGLSPTSAKVSSVM